MALTVRQLAEVVCEHCGQGFVIEGNRHGGDLDKVPWVAGGIIITQDGYHYHGYPGRGDSCLAKSGGVIQKRKGHKKLGDMLELTMREWFAKYYPKGKLTNIRFNVEYQWAPEQGS